MNEAEQTVLRREVDRLGRQLEQLLTTNALLHGTLEAIYQSRLWRYSAPLRKAKRRLDVLRRSVETMDRPVIGTPLKTVRGAGRWAADRPIFRRPAKRLLARWPALRWRVWKFLLVPPDQEEIDPFVVGAGNTVGQIDDKETFKMFAMNEPRKPVDVEALKARIHQERERQKTTRS
jgi:hypothetical protein